MLWYSWALNTASATVWAIKGMKQRVKLAQAFISNAPVLLLDEPCTNLDEEGIKLYEKMIQDFTKDKIVIIASNDPQETKQCTEKYYIRDFK